MESKTKEIVDRFNNAFRTHDATDFADLIADNCVLENTGPAPDGQLYEGTAAVKFWKEVIENKQLSWKLEEVYVVGDRAIIRWRLSWGKNNNDSVRGVNLMRIQDGKIVEARGYIKG